MEYHFYPPFFEVSPHPCLGDAWEAFCCDILNLDNKTTDIRRRTPPDTGVDLLWQSKRRAYQCKSVETGQAGDFVVASAIESMERAVKNRKKIGWDEYIICTNVEVTGTQEAKLRKVFSDVQFLTPSYWTPCCRRLHDVIGSRFRLLVRISEPAVMRSINNKFLDSYAQRLQASMQGHPLTLLVYSNRRKDIFDIPVSSDFTVNDLLEVLISLFELPNQRSYDGLGISVSLSYSLMIDEKKVPLNRKLGELGLSNNSIVTFWKTIVWEDERGKTDSNTIEMITMRSIEERTAGPGKRSQSAMNQFKKEIDTAFDEATCRLDQGKQGTEKKKTMPEEVEVAAYHEAAHVVALREAQQRAMWVCVNEDGSGVTTPDALPQGENLIRVALAGMMAEILRRGITDIFAFIRAYVGAASDRNLIVKAFEHPWLAHSSTGNWHQVQYNRAQAFNEKHRKAILALVKAVLAKNGFPKYLTETEIDSVLKK